MPYCAVTTCTAKSDTTTIKSIKPGGISFHRFPKEPNARERWIESTGRQNWIPTSSSTICSQHFIENDFNIRKSGHRFLKPGAIPTKQLFQGCASILKTAVMPVYCGIPVYIDKSKPSISNNLLPGAPGPSADKRARLASGDTQATGPNEDCLDGQHAATVPTVEQTQIPANRDTRQAHTSDECVVRELPIHLDIRCNVCLNDIVGFRYTCVQCVDWNMCASCEARGEHPEHYVLRLPAPKPKAESDTVLEAIRKYIDDLLQLNIEMHEIVFKEEPVQVKEEMDLDIEEHHLYSDLDDCSVPELTTNRETSIRNVPAIVHAEVKKEIDTDVEKPHLTPEFDIRDVPEVRTHRESSIRCVTATSHAEETTRHTSSPDDSDEQVVKTVRSLTGKTAPNDRHLVIYKTLERNQKKIKNDMKESAE